MYTWSLDSLYKSFNEQFENDFDKLSKLVDELNTVAQNLNDLASLEHWYSVDTELTTVATKLFAFVSLTLAADTQNTDASRWMTRIQPTFSNTSKAYSIYKKFVVANESNFTQWFTESETVKDQQFNIGEILTNAKHLLSEDVEDAISKMQINASSNWDQLQSHLTSLTTIEFNGETHTLSSIRNLAYSPDQATRKAAYEAELELYKKIEDSVAFALNSIKGEVNTVNTMRGYESPIEKTLFDSRMSKPTLDALIQAIENYLPTFREYFRHKAKLLGHDKGLPWYDLFAPFETSNPKTYSIEEAHSFIVNSFSEFSDDLAAMADTAFKDSWIDFLPREGKRGGAFCYNLSPIKQSRILTNYGGTISDIVTLAHELGHAYHGMQIENLSILNTDYTMPVAETASTFCENIVFNAAIKTVDDEEKLVLIENSITDLAQITVDILSRYKFETAVFERRNHEFLYPKDLNEIMIQAQRDTYGDGLDENVMHPSMWICKGHYYSAGLSFYNFPYAFGGLFALGLYSQFEKEGSSFVPKYQKLLQATTTATCEDVAKMADIDVTSVAFWESSLEVVKKRIENFIELTSK